MLVLHNVKMVPSSVMFWQSSIVGCLLVGTVLPKKGRVWYNYPLLELLEKYTRYTLQYYHKVEHVPIIIIFNNG